MNRFFLLLFTFLPLLSFSQIEKKVHSITKFQYDLEYYAQQAKEWRTVLDEQLQSEAAWENYYTAARMFNILSPVTEKHFNLKEIVAAAAIAIPETFAYHRIAAWNASLHESLKSYHLQKAYEINPQRPEIYESLIGLAMLNGEEEKAKSLSQKLYASNYISSSILEWNYNQLMSVEEKGILLTFGDNDTYPSWILQKAKSIRPDIAVVNIHLLHDSHYRDRLFEDIQVPPFEVKKRMIKLNAKDTLLVVIDHLIANSKRPIHLGVGAPEFLKIKYEDKLYLTGLTFKYSDYQIDNKQFIRRNIEEKFSLSDFKSKINSYPQASAVHRMNINYLPSFLKAYQFYLKNSEPLKAQMLKSIILKIAKNAKVEDRISPHLMSEVYEDRKPKINLAPERKSNSTQRAKITLEWLDNSTEKALDTALPKTIFTKYGKDSAKPVKINANPYLIKSKMWKNLSVATPINSIQYLPETDFGIGFRIFVEVIA